VREERLELLRYARQEIGKLTGLEQLCLDSTAWYAQMATIPLPPCDAGALKHSHAPRDEYRVEVPIIERSRRQLERVSVQGYNTLEDPEALVAALAALLPEVVP